MGIVGLVDINFDLLSVGIAIAGILLLGSIIYFNDRTSVTNRTFFVFSLLTALWGVSNYLEYRFGTVLATLWALRLHLFISTLHAFFYFRLAYVFPSTHVAFSRWYKFALVPVVAMTAILTLTPLVFSGIAHLAPSGYVTNPSRGPGIVLFSLVAFGLLLGALLLLGYKTYRARAQERKQRLAVFIGMTLTAGLILVFNVLLPIVFNQLSFIPLAALFILPFIALISYSIYQHHLFNLRVATTAVLGFMVTVFSFANIIYSTSLSEVALNVTAFSIILLGSIKIVRDTIALQELAENLAETNTRQEGLIHFIGHEVKGFLTKAQGTFAALSEGDLGPLSETMQPFVERALQDTRDGVTSVSDILKASNLKKGTTEYKKEPFNLKEVAQVAVEKARDVAEAKGLKLSFVADEGDFTLTGDKGEIADHVFRNLVDNSVNYTPTGSIDVTLKHADGKYVFTVKDTGVGITEEDKKRLFTEGGHGKESQKINVHSTGYGLFIAKKVTEGHGGTIRAESEGAGKGSSFIVELPTS